MFVRKPCMRRKDTEESVNYLAGVDAPHTELKQKRSCIAVMDMPLITM